MARRRKNPEAPVEVRIGVQHATRELVIESAESAELILEAVTTAVAGGSAVLALTDEKGRRFLVQTSKIAYVEIGAADVRRVGFGVGAQSAKTG